MKNSARFFLFASWVVVSVSCQNTKPEPKPFFQPAVVAVQPSAIEPLKEARDIGRKADVKNEEARTKISATRTGLDDAGLRVDVLSATVKALRDRGAATADELRRLGEELQHHKTKVLELIALLKEAEETLAQERELRAQMDEKLQDTRSRLVAKELEADTLRGQTETQAGVIEAMREQAILARDELVLARRKAMDEQIDRLKVARTAKILTVLLFLSALLHYFQFRKRG